MGGDRPSTGADGHAGGGAGGAEGTSRSSSNEIQKGFSFVLVTGNLQVTQPLPVPAWVLGWLEPF